MCRDKRGNNSELTSRHETLLHPKKRQYDRQERNSNANSPTTGWACSKRKRQPETSTTPWSPLPEVSRVLLKMAATPRLNVQFVLR
mmetsp:Transcript_29129/g.81902  ORF Transcript_29129/g.81902 Transcript_29129/m.81902 type:complete len:86 (-) Transcript_29129:2543-2800(-)